MHKCASHTVPLNTSLAGTMTAAAMQVLGNLETNVRPEDPDPAGDAMGSILPATTSTSAATTSTTTKSATAAPQGFSLSPTGAFKAPAPQPASGSGSGSGSGSDSGATTSDSTTPTQAPTAIVIFVFVGGQQSSQTPLLQRFDPSTVQDPALRALLAHPNPEQSAETRLFLPTDERSLVLKAAETADNTSQPSLLTKLETVSEPQLRLSSSEAVEGNSAGGVQLSGSPAANVVLIVVAGNSQPATLQLGGDPNSPFTLPMSESAAADQRLMNFGLLFAQDFSQSGWATRPVVLPPEPQLTAPEQAFRNNFLAALDRGDTLGAEWIQQGYVRSLGEHPQFAKRHYEPPEPTFLEGAFNGAANAMPKLLGGAVVVVAFTAVGQPEAGLVVGGLLLAGSAGSSAYSRYKDGQTPVQSIGGGVTDAFFVTPVYNGWTGVELWTREDLEMTDFERGQLFGDGGVGFMTVTVPLGAAGVMRFGGSTIRVAGNVIREVGNYRLSFADLQSTAPMGPFAGVTLVKITPEAQLPSLVISASEYPGMAENISHAQRAGHPSVLTYISDLATARANRYAAVKNVEQIAGLSRDEYPFASTLEGGGGAWVGHISPAEQSGQGGLLKNFYEKHNLKSGDQFIVVIIQ